MGKEPLTLRWNGQSLGQTTEVGWSDFPWRCGKLAITDLPPDLLAVLQWLARQADEENLADPPFQESFLEGWSLIDLEGASTEIGVPLVHLDTGIIEWR